MSFKTPYLFNRNEYAHILSPDPESLPIVLVDTENKIDSGIWIDVNGDPASAGKTKKWAGIVIESNYYKNADQTMKPSGNVQAMYGSMRVRTKQFTDDANAPIAKGDILTLINGKPAKPDDNNTVPLFEVLDRDTDSIEITTL